MSDQLEKIIKEMDSIIRVHQQSSHDRQQSMRSHTRTVENDYQELMSMRGDGLITQILLPHPLPLDATTTNRIQALFNAVATSIYKNQPHIVQDEKTLNRPPVYYHTTENFHLTYNDCYTYHLEIIEKTTDTGTPHTIEGIHLAAQLVESTTILWLSANHHYLPPDKQLPPDKLLHPHL